MQRDESLVTGIVAADEERLILRPAPVVLRRRMLLRAGAGIAAILVTLALALAYLFRPHVSYAQALIAAAVVSLFTFYQSATQVTFIALRGADGIYVETRNRVFRTRRRKRLHAYADITGVRLRSRVNPNAARPGVSPMGAFTHYDVLLDTRAGERLFWYTRHPESALEIGNAVARFAGVGVVDER